MRVRLSLISAALAGLPLPIQAHDIYSHLKDAGGGSCCDDRDCRPASYRFVAGDLQMLVDGQWIEVPRSTIQYRALRGTPAKRAEGTGVGWFTSRISVHSMSRAAPSYRLSLRLLRTSRNLQ